jgi:hypothetical protein
MLPFDSQYILGKVLMNWSEPRFVLRTNFGASPSDPPPTNTIFFVSVLNRSFAANVDSSELGTIACKISFCLADAPSYYWVVGFVPQILPITIQSCPK